tara:strand:+ start:1433 stop:2167 length:735 start_codon:yes stop_codon:yes gene_type:complete
MDHNINAVNVYAVDEEKLKFRIIIAINGLRYRQAPPVVARSVLDGDGQYEIDIPVPTAIANSEKYNQCLIKCDVFSASAPPGVAAPTWCQGYGIPGGGGAGDGITLKAPVVELQLNTATSQTSNSIINDDYAAAQANLIQSGNKSDPIIDIGGYRQIIPGQIVNVGNGVNFTVTNAGQGWLGMLRDTNPLLCSNPFGQKIRLRFIDPLSRSKMCLMNNAALANGDVGKYHIQLEVTMVPNKTGC